jgi:DNA polymerase (family 10)
MPHLDASSIASLLREFGRRTRLYGGNPYRAKAYLRAADSVGLLTQPIGELIAANRLLEIPGVGDAIAGVITTLFETGSHPTLEKMRAEVPESVLEMLTIPGLRPEKVLKLHKELGIATIEELEVAAKQDRLRGVPGLGPALQRKILAGLETRRSSLGAKHIHRAAELLATARDNLENSNLGLKAITVAGDFRRGSELVSDLALVAEKEVAEAAQLRFGELTVHVANHDRLGAARLFPPARRAISTSCANSQRKREWNWTSTDCAKKAKSLLLAQKRKSTRRLDCHS